MVRDWDRMQRTLAKFGALLLLVALMAGFARPAAAEFFGCNEQHASRAISYSRSSYGQAHYTHEFSAQSRMRHYSYRRAGDRRSWNVRSQW